MSTNKQSLKELYSKVERQAHSLRGNPREYQVITGLCPVNVIELHAQKILALLDELEAAEKRIAELEAKLANPVLLPKTNGYWTEQEKAYEDAITLAKRQVRLAGFSVEDM